MINKWFLLKHTVHEKSISKKITPQDINNVFEEENSMSGIDSSKINYFGELINLLEQKKNDFVHYCTKVWGW